MCYVCIKSDETWSTVKLDIFICCKYVYTQIARMVNSVVDV